MGIWLLALFVVFYVEDFCDGISYRQNCWSYRQNGWINIDVIGKK